MTFFLTHVIFVIKVLRNVQEWKFSCVHIWCTWRPEASLVIPSVYSETVHRSVDQAFTKHLLKMFTHLYNSLLTIVYRTPFQNPQGLGFHEDSQLWVARLRLLLNECSLCSQPFRLQGPHCIYEKC